MCQCRAVDWELEGVEAALELIWPVSVQSTSPAVVAEPLASPPRCQLHPADPPDTTLNSTTMWGVEEKKVKKKKKIEKTSREEQKTFITTCNSNTFRCCISLCFFLMFLWWLCYFLICFGCDSLVSLTSFTWSLWDRRSLIFNWWLFWRSGDVKCTGKLYICH